MYSEVKTKLELQDDTLIYKLCVTGDGRSGDTPFVCVTENALIDSTEEDGIWDNCSATCLRRLVKLSKNLQIKIVFNVYVSHNLQ